VGVYVGTLLCGISLFISAEWYFSQEKVYKMCDIIRQYVLVAEHLMILEAQVNHFAVEDPVLDVIRNHVQPLQDRITSLRVQTSQYEQMRQKIPGGPTSFIASSLKELDRIEQSQLTLINEALGRVVLHAKEATQLEKQTTAFARENQKLADETVIELCLLEGIIWIPVTPEEEEELNHLASFTTLNQTIPTLLSMAELYEDLMYVGLNASEVAQQMGYRDLPALADVDLTNQEYDIIGPYLVELIRLKRAVEEAVVKHLRTFQLFWELKSRLMKKLAQDSQSLRSYETQKRWTLMNIQTMILKDISSLRVRLSNLQFTYAKQKVDL